MTKKISPVVIISLAILAFTFFYYFKDNLNLNLINNEETNDLVIQERSEETKYDNIQVYSREERKNDKRSLLHVSYPVTENQTINQELQSLTNDFVKEYEGVSLRQEEAYQAYIKNNQEEVYSLRSEYFQHFDISLVTPNYLLVVIDRFVSTGGTGSQELFSLLFDRKSGQRLELASMFSSADYLQVLSEKSREILIDRVDNLIGSLDFSNEEAKSAWRETSLEHIRAGTTAEKDNFNALVISETGKLVIYFDKYQVGPGSDGIVSIELDLEEISDILSKEVKDFFSLKESEEDSNDLVEDNNETKPNFKVNCQLEPCVALTFDDGPSLYTDKLLDILKEHEVLASFFVLGRSAKIQPDTIRRIVKEGHQLGNHSWSHKDLTAISSAELNQQIFETDKLIKKIANYDLKYLRPPYGAYDKNLQELIDRPIIIWNVDPKDWLDKDTPTVIERMSQAESGSIVLAHDIYETTIEAIPQVIENLQNKGINLVSLDNLFASKELEKGKVYGFLAR